MSKPLTRLALRLVVDARQARVGDLIELGELTRRVTCVNGSDHDTTLVVRDGSITFAHGVRIVVQRH
ncbi:hypothetical protein ACMA1D_09775 [Streptomyces sp. 796.1]|uniref:hypothetical protein n=1 Tax=Streptomyces sp. 796.1 TaxID=3163029 RepID=UPI0039C9B273